MPVYSGKFEYRDEGSRSPAQGTGRFTFDDTTATLTPETGRPIGFDWGDVNEASFGDWSLGLKLFTGRTLELKQFGAAFGRMANEIRAAWRDRTVRCLLLGDLPEVSRYDGAVAVNGETPRSAEIRLYESNIAVLPVSGAPAQWRLADVDEIRFDDRGYATVFQSGDSRMAISKLAGKTDEFQERARSSWDALRTETANALHAHFPFLNPDQLGDATAAMPEGRSARLADLARIHPQLPERIAAQAIGPRLRPYFDKLQEMSERENAAVGFKFIRGDEDEPEEDAQEERPDPNLAPLFFWFFLPITGKPLIAWEATTGSGRATYLFGRDLASDVQPQIERLTRGLALVNFRREPVYLSDESLDSTPRFHRYRIGARKLPDLKTLRQAYVGRAIHSTLEEWQGQMAALTA